MPLIQKLIHIGDSRGVTIPKSWLDYYEKQFGYNIREVAVEVKGKLTIRPVLKEVRNNQPNIRK